MEDRKRVRLTNYSLSLESEEQLSSLVLVKLFRLVPRIAKLDLGFLLRGSKILHSHGISKIHIFIPNKSSSLTFSKFPTLPK